MAVPAESQVLSNSPLFYILAPDDASSVGQSEIEQAISHCFLSFDCSFVLLDDFDRLAAAFSETVPDAVLLTDKLANSGSVGQAMAQLRELTVPCSVPLVLLSQTQDTGQVVEYIDAGADDFIAFPLHPSLVASKLRALLRVRDMHQIVQQQNEQIRLNHEHMLMEQQVAKDVFNRIAHNECVDMPNIQRWLSPIAAFNGDIFLAAPTPGGGLLALLGDFTGHGLAAAIGALPLASTFYGMAGKGFAMPDIIKELNSKLKDILPVNVFCCASMVYMDFEKGSIDIWNAGLPANYIVRTDVAFTGDEGAYIEPVSSTSLPLGIVDTSELKIEVQHFTLGVGDRLVLLSDGVLEATNVVDEQFGEDRLLQALHNGLISQAETPFSCARQDIVDFIGDNSRADDISLVEIAMIDASDFAENHSSSGRVGVQEPVSWSSSYEVRPDSLRHQDPVPLLLHTLMEVPALRKFSSQLYTIFTELYTNALDHGLLDLPSSLKHQPDGFARYYHMREQRLASLQQGFVRFSLDYQGDGRGGRLCVDVEDSGKGFDCAALDSTLDSTERLHGRGIPLIRAICHSVEFLGAGNHVRVHFHWSAD